LTKDVQPRIPAGIETKSLARLFYWEKSEERRNKCDKKKLIVKNRGTKELFERKEK
jgi:hypothetical protein